MKKRNGVVLTSAVLLVSLLLGGCGSKEGAEDVLEKITRWSE